MTKSGSRFAGLTRRAAIAVLALFAIVMSVSLWEPSPAHLKLVQSAPVKKDADLALYRAISQRVAKGESYYPAAADELRKGDYPLKPFLTFRLPTFAWITAYAGPMGMMALRLLLVIGTLYAWWKRLEGTFDDPGRRVQGALLVVAGLAVAVSNRHVQLHEFWAGTLLALSFALHRPDRWWPSVLAAACALALRELALPFVLLMGAFALFGRRWREMTAWGALALAFAAGLWLHSREVAAVVLPGDPQSPGWTSLGGWPAFLRFMHMTGPLRALPDWVSAILTVLSLFGWASWKSRTGLFGTLLFLGYGLMFMLLGRPTNFYWGLMITPVFALGLVFLPQAFSDLRASIRPHQLDLKAD